MEGDRSGRPVGPARHSLAVAMLRDHLGVSGAGHARWSGGVARRSVASPSGVMMTRRFVPSCGGTRSNVHGVR